MPQSNPSPPAVSRVLSTRGNRLPFRVSGGESGQGVTVGKKRPASGGLRVTLPSPRPHPRYRPVERDGQRSGVGIAFVR